MHGAGAAASAPRPEPEAPRPEPDIHAAVVACARAAEAQKAHDIEVFDVGGILVVTQYFLVCTCDSGPQLRAVLEALADCCAQAGLRKLGREIDTDSSWGLLDYGDVVCHVFRPEARVYYALEDLWADAPRVVWRG